MKDDNQNILTSGGNGNGTAKHSFSSPTGPLLANIVRKGKDVAWRLSSRGNVDNGNDDNDDNDGSANDDGWFQRNKPL